MSGPELLAWYSSGPQKQDTKPKDPKEALQNLYGVSLQGRIDFDRGLLFGKLKEHKFLFKHGEKWGDWPVEEMLELETQARVFFAYQDILKNAGKTKQVEVPEHVKQKNMARSKGMYAYLEKV